MSARTKPCCSCGATVTSSPDEEQRFALCPSCWHRDFPKVATMSRAHDAGEFPCVNPAHARRPLRVGDVVTVTPPRTAGRHDIFTGERVLLVERTGVDWKVSRDLSGASPWDYFMCAARLELEA